MHSLSALEVEESVLLYLYNLRPGDALHQLSTAQHTQLRCVVVD